MVVKEVWLNFMVTAGEDGVNPVPVTATDVPTGPEVELSIMVGIVGLARIF